MSRWYGFLPAALFLLVMHGGCKTSDDGPVTPPGPQGIAEVEPNDAVPQALGTLGTSDLTVNGATAGTADEDWYSVTLASQTNLHASVDWGTGDIDLGLTDASGIVVAFRDTGAKPERCTLPLRTPGTYRIRVSSKTGGAVAYTLTIGPR
jgi:hypothetical protein